MVSYDDDTVILVEDAIKLYSTTYYLCSTLMYLFIYLIFYTTFYTLTYFYS